MNFRHLSVSVVIFAFVALASFATRPAQATPVAPASLAAQAASMAPTEKARVFCYNRFNGQFLHWGSCGGYYHRHYRPYRRHYYRPRYSYHPHYYRPRYYYHRPRWHLNYY